MTTTTTYLTQRPRIAGIALTPDGLAGSSSSGGSGVDDVLTGAVRGALSGDAGVDVEARTRQVEVAEGTDATRETAERVHAPEAMSRREWNRCNTNTDDIDNHNYMYSNDLFVSRFVFRFNIVFLIMYTEKTIKYR